MKKYHLSKFNSEYSQLDVLTENQDKFVYKDSSAGHSSNEVLFATSIEWDTDGDIEIQESLPRDVELPTFLYDEYDHEGGESYADTVADWLSDNYGYCVFGFSLDKRLKE